MTYSPKWVTKKDILTSVLQFQGAGGLIFSSLYGYNENLSHSFSGSGIANKTKIVAFTVDGETHGDISPDSTSKNILVNIPGRYFVSCSLTCESDGPLGALYGFAVFTNNGTNLYETLHAHRDLAGAGGETGAVEVIGIGNFNEGDTIEVWVYNETNTQSIIIDDISLSAIYIGR